MERRGGEGGEKRWEEEGEQIEGTEREEGRKREKAKMKQAGRENP